MKKYLVKIEYNNKRSFVQIFKAKDDRALEKRVLKEYYDNIDDVAYYEYERLTRRKMFDGFFLCGTWCGVSREDEHTSTLLKEIEEENKKDEC